MLNDGTYGFNSADANALLDLIATHDVEHEEIKPIGVGGGTSAGVEIFEYVLTFDMSFNSSFNPGRFVALGSVRSVSNLTASFAGQVFIYDILGTAAHQLSGDRGICARVSGGPHVVIEPACDFDNFSPGGGGNGVPPINPIPLP